MWGQDRAKPPERDGEAEPDTLRVEEELEREKGPGGLARVSPFQVRGLQGCWAVRVACGRHKSKALLCGPSDAEQGAGSEHLA